MSESALSQTKKTPKIKKSKLASKIAAAAAAGAFMISQESSAQTDAGDLVNLSSLDGVANASIQADGSLLVELTNGQTITVPAGDFVEENGQFLVDQDLLEGLAGGNGPNLALLGLGAAALAGVGIALATGGGDDDEEVVEEPPVVEEEPVGPTDGNDVLEGTDGDDNIDGLAGDDDISGLAGNDTLIGGAGNDTLTGGTGDDVLLGGGGTDAIDGGDGVDTNSFEDIGQAVTASIADGTADYGGVSETFSNIENLTGTNFNDSLTGDGGDNVLLGLDGNDTLAGGAGNDTLTGGAGDDLLIGGGGADIIDGGDGIDTNSFAGIGVGVTATVNADGSGTADYGMVSETFTGIENLTGSDNDDILVATGAAANTIFGGAGDDLIAGGGGTDILDGGDGNDTNSFQGIGGDVTASLVDGTATYGAVSETFVNFENLTGGSGNDTLTGDANANTLDGADGNDTLIGGAGNDTLTGGAGDDVLLGGGGTDIIDGGDGVDTNSFEDIGQAVTASIADGTATYGGVSETFVNIENLTGTNLDDNLTGDGGDNVLLGLDGNDTLTGGAGNDTLTGGAGDDLLIGGGGTDIIDGGAGIDTNSFAGIGVGVTATVAADGSGTADYGMVSETFTGIENLTGSDNNDILVATGAAANTIFGGAGDDLIAGGGGTDILDGGDGNDTNSFQGIGGDVTASLVDGTATYGAVSETFANFENLTGGSGNDTLTGDANANTLNGADGDDTLIGGAGNDTLTGGAGDDVLLGGGGTDIIDGGDGVDTNSFAGIGVGVTATVAADGSGTATYGGVSETFTNIENLTGSDNNDVLIATGAAANTIFGGAGDDLIAGGGGTDILDGGDGNDTNSFQGIGADVTASLVDGTATYGAVSETFVNFENLIGGTGNDTLTGDASGNTLDGADGNDTLAGGAGADTLTGGAGDDVLLGGGGTDIIDGGAGIDTNSFADIGPAVTASIAAGTATYGGVSETFVNIENLTGTNSDDSLTGDAGTNVLSGLDGDDTLVGGAGNDILDGGAGFDTADYSTSSVPIIVDLDENGNGTVTRDVGFGVEVVDAQVADDAVFIAAAEAGNLYFNVHTEEFGGGEIRGQLAVTSDETVGGVRTIVLDASLDSAQEPNDASDSDATGTGQVTITIDADGNATYSSILDITGISPSELITLGDGALSAIHLHNAPAGQNGPVLQDIIVDAGGATDGSTAEGDVIQEVTEVDQLISIENVIFSENNDVLNPASGDQSVNGGDGNDTLFGGAGNDTLTGGAGDDLIAGGGGTDIIDGGDGVDTNSFADIGPAVTASIAAGTATYGGVSETFVNIENLTGTNSDDSLTGDSGANVLLGLDGDDTLTGGGGADTLTGGAGDDLLLGGGGTDIIDGGDGVDTNSFADIGPAVTASIAAGTATYGMVSETFVNIENLTGTNSDDSLTGDTGANVLSGLDGNDTLTGGGGADTLTGGSGDDVLLGGGGTDIIDGGAGNDTNSFADIGLGTTASIAAGTASYGGVSETFVNIENLTGTNFDDNLTGDASANVLLGLDGNDTLTGGGGADTLTGGAGDDVLLGGGGTDIIDGGAGVDTNSFADIGLGTTASIAAGTASYGGVSETFVNIENLTGTNFDDNLTGDTGDNVLLGLDGDDALAGGAGNDTIDGGDGFDTVTFLDVAANITAVRNLDGTFTVSSALDGTNTLSNIEALVDSAGVTLDLPPNVLADGTSDLSGSGAAPDQFTLVEGSNTISNTVVNAQGTGTTTTRDVDIFTVTVPEGFTLTEINITNFVSADNVGFAAVIVGNTFPIDFASGGTDSSGFLGLALFGDNNDLLADLAGGIGASPFVGFDATQGLSGGVGGTSYTFLIQQNGNNVIDYTFDFVLTPDSANPATTTVKVENPFTSAESDFDFVPEAASILSEAEFDFDPVEEIGFGSFDDLGDVFEVA